MNTLLLLGKRLDSLERDFARRLPWPDPKVVARAGELPPGFARAMEEELLRLIQSEYGAVAEVSLSELAQYHGGRAYADWGGLLRTAWRHVADYYHMYIPKLVGQFTQDLMLALREVLHKAEREGKSTDEVADDIQALFRTFTRGRVTTIARTEGTRAASLARREIAIIGNDMGIGPRYYLGSAILDDRVTHTCQFWHGHGWSLDEDEAWGGVLHTPNHYNCRSMVTYSWEEPKRRWTEERLARWLEIQKREFPKWDNGWVQVEVPDV